MSQETPYIFDATTADFDQSVIENSFHKPVLVDFWAEWCPPCKAMDPILDDLSVELAGRVKIVKLDVESNPGIVTQYNVRAMPTLMVFKGGEPVGQIIGFRPKGDLKKRLDDALAARDVHLIFLDVDPRWDALRDDPRFRSLRQRAGLGAGAAP